MTKKLDPWICLHLVFCCGREKHGAELCKKNSSIQLTILSIRYQIAEAVMKKFSTKQLLHNCWQAKSKKKNREGSHISVKLKAGSLQLHQTS